VDSDGLSGMDRTGVGLRLKQGKAADGYLEALGINLKLAWVDARNIYRETIPRVKPADEGVGGEGNFIGDGNCKLGERVDGVNRAFDEIL